MKHVIFSSLFISSVALAADQTCGEMNRQWTACKSASDCTWVADGCGKKRIAANKLHAAAAEKFYSCQTKQEDCGNDYGGETNTILKCEAYGVKFAGVKSPKPSCMGLSTVADFAINNNDRQKLEAVIAESRDVDMSLSHIHETPLSLASLNAKTEIVRWLLGKGAKVNFQTKNGYTSLMFAATSRSEDKKSTEETIKLLLASGADKNLRNSRGESALDQAKAAKNVIAVKLLQ